MKCQLFEISYYSIEEQSIISLLFVITTFAVVAFVRLSYLISLLTTFIEPHSGLGVI